MSRAQRAEEWNAVEDFHLLNDQRTACREWNAVEDFVK